MFRVGKVVAVDDKTAKARVQIEDADKVISYWLPVIATKTQDDKFYWLPDIGEEVLIGFLDYGIEQGFILGAIYNEKDQPPVADRNKMHIKFKDGSIIEYDRQNNKLYLDIKGQIDIVVAGSTNIISNGDINITIGSGAGNVNVNGNIITTGNITALGQIADLGGSKGTLSNLRDVYNSHTHTGDSGGTTSAPNQKVG